MRTIKPSEFISLVHSHNTDDFIDIRAIGNNEQDTRQYFYKLSQIKELDNRIAPDKNMYFGVYSRGYKNGSAKACNKTRALWVDIDNTTIEQANLRLVKAGIPQPSITVSSGHGIHFYWLLKEPAGNEAILVIKALAKAINADMRATDKARIMRIPSTWNIKNDPVLCEVVEASKKEYELKELAEILNISKEPKQEYKPALLSFTKNIKQPCIKEMFKGVPEGHRNFALGRLTKHLQLIGKNKSQAKNILLEWNKLNDPPEQEAKLKRDIDSYFKKDYKLLGCALKDSGLQFILSDYCNKRECDKGQSTGTLKLDNTVNINNRAFKQYEKVNGYDLIVLTVLLKYPQGLNRQQIKEALFVRSTKQCFMTERTIRKALSNLKAKQLIEYKNIKPKGTDRINYFAKAISNTFGMGYTLISNGAIHGAIDGRIKPSELKLYILLLRYAYHSKTSVYPGTVTMAKVLGVSQPRVVKALDNLEQNGYIERSFNYELGHKLEYRLLV